jgi:SAM-dependent methyltransferase
MLQLIRRAAQPLFRKVPRLRSLALTGLDLAARPVLLPFRLGRPPSNDVGAASLEGQTAALNRAAEDYFAAYPNPEHLVGKPFSEPESLSRRLIDLGVLLYGLRLSPGDVVLDLGAGTCWVSHLFNRFGCRTIAVDVSPTALAIGRTMFERDPQTNWTLEPAFLPYDGHTLPVADASVDRVVLYDAFHHIPNPGRLLREMRRVLKPDGIVGMSEPGRGHSTSPPSVAETAATGVLERELVLEDIADQAMAAGFTSAPSWMDTTTSCCSPPIRGPPRPGRSACRRSSRRKIGAASSACAPGSRGASRSISTMPATRRGCISRTSRAGRGSGLTSTGPAKRGRSSTSTGCGRRCLPTFRRKAAGESPWSCRRLRSQATTSLSSTSSSRGARGSLSGDP